MRRAGTNYTCGNTPTLGGSLYGNLSRWCIVHNMVELCWTGGTKEEIPQAVTKCDRPPL